MKKFIFPWQALLILAVIAGIVGGIQLIIHHETKPDPKVATDVTCVVQESVVVDGGKEDDKVALELDCQGQKAVLKDAKVVVSYLQDPRPLTCTVYKSGKTKCQLPEQ